MIDGSESAQCPDVDLVVVDRDRVRMALAVDDWNATTLLACVSEDPAEWSELAGVWPRYQIGSSAGELKDLDFVFVDFDAAIEQLSNDRAWMVIDMRTKRVCIGKSNDPMERDGCYTVDGDNFETEFRVPVHLPPWWEFHCHSDLSIVGQPRQEEMRVFQPRRDVLWGPELARGLAERMLARIVEDERLFELMSELSTEFSSPPRSESDEDESVKRLRGLRSALYARTVDVHRDWLMTPRADLNGRTPRECLHGGTDWIERVIEGQKWHVSPDRPLTPIPESMAKNPDVPMGRSEVCLYFDLCRELIDAGWVHLGLQGNSERASDPKDFAKYLSDVQQSWMRTSSYERSDSPASIIESERQRLPRVVDAEHAGAIDCDCPICEMMKIGTFGPTFVGIDGHHLELDDEFAFSLHETREDWEENQREFEEMSRAINENREGHRSGEVRSAEKNDEEDDDFGSVWKSTYVGHGGIPGDTKGHIEISFLLADMISSLKDLGAQNDVDELNQAFREYRVAGRYELATVTEQFQNVLEQVALRHSDLVSRSADLQHRLDEWARREEKLD